MCGIPPTPSTAQKRPADWQYAYDYWTANKANRQLNWDRLYYANKQAALLGLDAPYYLEAKHNNNLTLNLASTYTKQVGEKGTWNAGFQLGQNIGHHFKTMDDLLGASYIHNINTYAVGNYDISNPAVQYDLNTAGPNGLGKVIYKGDRFGYDYDLRVQKGLLWTNYSVTTGRWHLMAAAKARCHTDEPQRQYAQRSLRRQFLRQEQERTLRRRRCQG